MKSIRSRFVALYLRLRQSRPQPADVRMRITNVTRRNELADRAEVADHGPRRRKGLLGRNGLAAGEALWIVPCEAIHTFGMRFPIDLVYLDRQRRIVKVKSCVRPGRLSACLSAHSVIELPAGAVSASNATPGDTLVFESALSSFVGDQSRLGR